MFRLTTLAFAAALLVHAPVPGQDAAGAAAGADQTGALDQTVSVQKGARIDLTDCAGDVTVRTWERDSVRVRATPVQSRTQIKVTPVAQVIVISASRSTMRDRTSEAMVDYELTVPAWINLHIEGEACSAEVTGVTGAVVVKSTEGDVLLRDVGGPIEAESMEGEVRIEGARGRIRATSSDADITISRSSGEIVAESIDGDVKLIDVRATAVEATTVDGDIVFVGPFQPAGKYRFDTHDGDVTLTIPEDASATFGLRTFSGDLQTTFPLKAVGDVRRGRRVIYTLGGGAAQLEVSTFGGDIHIRKPGEAK